MGRAAPACAERPAGVGRAVARPGAGRRSAVWVSADLPYRSGGGATNDDIPDGNPTRGWSAGITGALKVRGQASIILTWEHVVSRSDNGPDGWFFRTALVVPFR